MKSAARDPKYLAWVRTLPCLVCASFSRIEAAHTGPHGMSQKSPDRTAVPLCARHHRTGNHSYHKLGSKAFQSYHALDLSSAVATLNQKPVIRIQGGRFVAYCGTEVYEVGSVGKGLRSAVRKAIAFAFENNSDAILDGAPGNRTQKARNLAGEPRCRTGVLNADASTSR